MVAEPPGWSSQLCGTEAPGRAGTPPAAVPTGTTRERQPPRDGCWDQAARTATAAAPSSPWRGPGPPLTHAGHAGHVQLEAIEAVAGVALPDTHTAPVLAAVEDPALLSLQPLEALVEAWKVARRCQSRVTLCPATEGTSGNVARHCWWG